MKKLSIHLIFFSLLIVALAFSCSTEVEDTTSTPVVQIPDPETEPEPEPEPVPVEYTLSVSSTEGGTVSSEGGTYDEGAEVTITATANEGYAFIGWDGIDSTNETLTITLNSNLSIEPIFQLIQTNESGYYSNGEIVSIDPIVFYDRELVVNGIKLIVAGDIGGQLAVPDFWIYKTARVFELLIDKDGEDIDANSQLNMIKTLKGEIGWHQGYPAGQRIARGGGNEYSPNFLDDNRNQSYPGIEAFEDALALDDMVWYKNIDSQGTGDDDINEILEHTLHTLHRFGVRGGVQGSTEALNIEAEEEDISNTEVFLAMKEAYVNGVFDIEGYGGNINNQDAWPVMLKEYQYLLTYGMWGFNEFWEGGSLSPEWNDNARTPEGVLANNPLGYELYNAYFKPVISIPSKEILRAIFQDNDQGESGYTSD
ncbi:MAG: hypothetical protein HOK87_08020 [Flavobacteriaceae bacterium]|jgi:hypothetical protein|nr:hypothetical protein [Flavobacteriaceae bacterium]MBT4312754.1 hypothetical protein [Flavobacteriaceae bacterium]MBT5447307.1 hypothetical protein [Flavobacteriaceae bacterium]MBT5693577.1 hypothetical protein [Flavobacteriaceae bacterium]MBT6953374.1 hypothetical protein [Flavobacteriaceae bacterium]